ncbi:hypothetical protein [Winogradskya humida]|uniref:Transcriptional regulator n=1 Tax=Winogradskya humida TaxID=113566 RepID=A0ABQ3ZVI3_9ACTN|nr:hypothetical protein [Actinoplanes humidus]GIE22177.1 hypothetical protein Ahu01nite_052790 [Actinoplanes humidus]
MEAAALPSRFAEVHRRIPSSWQELRGPAAGVVHLPNRLCWSGPADFDVTDAGQRLTLYTTLLDCGQLGDVVEHINPDLLEQDWPKIRRLTARQLVHLWEQRLLPLAMT